MMQQTVKKIFMSAELFPHWIAVNIDPFLLWDGTPPPSTIIVFQWAIIHI